MNPLIPRCWNCGYNLTGLRGRRCPECGEAFSAGSPVRIAGRGRPNWRGLILTHVAGVGGVVYIRLADRALEVPIWALCVIWVTVCAPIPIFGLLLEKLLRGAPIAGFVPWALMILLIASLWVFLGS